MSREDGITLGIGLPPAERLPTFTLAYEGMRASSDITQDRGINANPQPPREFF